MGIEAPTLVDSSGEICKDIFELPNGCICCSVRDDMVAALDNLLEKFPGKFDYVLVETTGVSDPEPVATAFWVDEGLQSNLVLDGIVTLVDLKNFDGAIGVSSLSETDLDQSLLAILAKQNEEKHLTDNDASGFLGLQKEAIKQVAAADKIILNKTDLVDRDHVNRVTKIVRALNPIAEIQETKRSEVDLSTILGLKAFDPHNLMGKLEGVHQVLETQLGDCHECADGNVCSHNEEDTECNHAHDHKHKHAHDHAKMSHSHAHGGVDSCFISIDLIKGETSIDAELLEPVLGDIIWGRQAGEIYRCKGLFYGLYEEDDEEGRMFKEEAMCVLQGVGESFEIVPLKRQMVGGEYLEADGKTIKAKFLFVGVNLDRGLLYESIMGLVKKVPTTIDKNMFKKNHTFDDNE